MKTFPVFVLLLTVSCFAFADEAKTLLDNHALPVIVGAATDVSIAEDFTKPSHTIAKLDTPVEPRNLSISGEPAVAKP